MAAFLYGGMKMKKLLSVLMLLALCSGCGVTGSFETVRDVLPTVGILDAPSELCVSVPQDAEIIAANAAGSVYEARNGDYTIETRVLVSDSFDAALYALSGENKPRFHIETGDRCQAAWCCAGERGEVVCRAEIVREGDFYYAAVFGLREGLGCVYQEEINEVFSSLTLMPSQDAEVFSEDVADESVIPNDVPAVVAVQNFHRAGIRDPGQYCCGIGRSRAQIERA